MTKIRKTSRSKIHKSRRIQWTWFDVQVITVFSLAFGLWTHNHPLLALGGLLAGICLAREYFIRARRRAASRRAARARNKRRIRYA